MSQAALIEMLCEQLGNTTYRLNEYRKRCGCLSMAGVCRQCERTIGVEQEAYAVLLLARPATPGEEPADG